MMTAVCCVFPLFLPAVHGELAPGADIHRKVTVLDTDISTSLIISKPRNIDLSNAARHFPFCGN